MDLEAIEWQATRHPGVALHFYTKDRSANRVVALIRMAPGCGYPAHRHVGPEDVLVLQGGYRDAFGEHEAATFVHYPAGSSHAPTAIDGPGAVDCVLLAVAHEGVVTLP